MTSATARPPTLGEAFPTWARIGLLSFGGPAGQIALMHRVLVDEKRWIDERSYLSALNFCMLLPGPEAMQLATYVGWRLHGVKGGLVAGLSFVLPGAAIVLALSLFYAAYGSLTVVQTVFVGVKAAVLAIVVEALMRVARRALADRADWLIAAAAFLAIYALAVPFPVIVLAAATIGFLRGGADPEPLSAAAAPPIAPSRTLRTVALWLAVWIAPLAAITLVFGADHVLARLAWFFSKLAVVAFGGAYAALAYMAQEAVQGFGWLAPGEMLDGLGLAETTPGPLVLVTEFVGVLAAYRLGGFDPIVMGVAGAVVALWATFAPSFLWIFAGAPYVERLTAAPRLASALRAVTAAVVGVILNLSLWFTLHVLFGRVSTETFGPARLLIPDVATVNWLAVDLAMVAAFLLFALGRGVLMTLLVCAALAAVPAMFDLDAVFRLRP